jgi:hypothetical protein
MSPPAILSEHSAIFAEHDAPFQGSMLEDFVNHEPFGMFRETGDTVADMSSCQERLVAEAMADFVNAREEPMTRATPVESLPSPSFPYSSSRRPTQKVAPVDCIERGHEQPSSEGNITLNVAADCVGLQASDPKDEKHDASAESSPRPSPIVILPAAAAKAATPLEQHSVSPSANTRRRKRTIETSTINDMDEDELACGLPKEQYRPRPSRRRATNMIDEPLDKPVAGKLSSKKRRKTDSTPVTTIPKSTSDENDPYASGKASTASRDRVKQAVIDQDETTKNEAHTGEMKPPPSISSSGRKVSRSHTTIFEDHVNANTFPKSPSLSQRQALRRSALKDISNESAELKPRRQSRKVLQDSDDDEDDDEDELSRMNDVDEAPTVKRGRGRPSKVGPRQTSFKAPTDLAELEDSTVAADMTETRPKKGRGRPKKAKAAQVKLDDKVISDDDDDDDDEVAPDTGSTRSLEAVVVVPVQTTPSVVSSAQAPTPPPEKAITEATPEPKPAKAVNLGPVMHSPIKKCLTTTTTKYRVGLSKRQRIQPLHSSIRKR